MEGDLKLGPGRWKMNDVNEICVPREKYGFFLVLTYQYRSM
jgi:hypothetical protein